MSYSSDLKNELLEIMPKNVHCKIAELAGIVSVNGRIEKIDSSNENDLPSEQMIIRVENPQLDDTVLKLIRMCTKIPDDNITLSDEKKHHRKLVITDESSVLELSSRLKLIRQGSRLTSEGIVTQKNCCKKAFVRGAFLAGGYVNNPEKAYQLEISMLSLDEAEKLIRMIESLGLSAKYVERKDRFVVYIKDGDTIANLLGVLGASSAMMEFENIRILKDIRNNINREVNCEASNLKKAADAANKQINDINYIKDNVGLDALPENLKQVAEMRLEYPVLSLKELGEMFSPPLGKSGISHRLRKISEFAEELR